MNWYLKVLQNYVNFEGRARRTEYWMFTLINFVISLGIGFIANLIGLEVLGTVYSLAVLLPGIAVAVRRLHDIGKSGWMYLLIFLPVIGWIWLIVLLATEGNAGPNEYGEDPKNENALSGNIDAFGNTEEDINTEAQEETKS